MKMDCICQRFCPKYGSVRCNQKCLKCVEMTYLLKQSGIPQKRREIVPLIESMEDARAISAVRDMANDIVNLVNNGQNIILWSEKTGNGKTTMAINLMIAYFNEIWAGNGFRTRGYFLYVPTYLNRCKDNISRFDEALIDLKQRALHDDLLILDDLGATGLSEYDVSILSNIINERINEGKSIITTTNCNKKQLAKIIGERMVDRLWSTSAVIHLSADSYRGVV